MSELDIRQILRELPVLHDELSRYSSAMGVEPSPQSKLRKEMLAYPGAASKFMTVLGQGNILIEAAADHLMAFTKTLTEPAQAIAPWTCVRAIIESCALSAWLFEFEIDALDRLKRSFAFRYEGQRQQLALSRSTGSGADTAKVETRISEIEKEALRLGIAPMLNKRGQRTGIGLNMPSATELAKKMLGEEIMYRVLSGIAHAHPWALQQTSFQPSNPPTMTLMDGSSELTAMHTFEKHIAANSVFMLSSTAASCLARPVWYQSQLFGWDSHLLSSILGRAFDSLHIAHAKRCWE